MLKIAALQWTTNDFCFFVISKESIKIAEICAAELGSHMELVDEKEIQKSWHLTFLLYFHSSSESLKG